MKWLISLLIRFVPRRYLQLFSGAGLKVVGLFYAGGKVQCPICGNRYRKFLPYGRLRPRSNALCAGCLSLERHRLLWLYLREKTDFFDRKLQVLHVAPEPCFIRRFEALHGDGYVTGDIESPLAKVKMDIHQMPFAEGRFDVVLCNHVLEHVKDDIQALVEIRRVLKPGAWAVVQVPFFWPVPETTLEDPSITGRREREKAFGQDDHVRRFGRDYIERISKSGLQGTAEDFGILLSSERKARHGLPDREVIYIAKKPH